MSNFTIQDDSAAVTYRGTWGKLEQDFYDGGTIRSLPSIPSTISR